MKQTKHDKGLDDVLNHIIFEKLDGIQMIAKEVKFYRGKDLVAEPDGIIYNGNLFVLEYKCSDKHRDKAEQQLNIASDFIRHNLGLYVPIQKIFAYNNNMEGLLK